MARDLHPTCISEQILIDLRSKGLATQEAINVIKKEQGRRQSYQNTLAVFYANI